MKAFSNAKSQRLSVNDRLRSSIISDYVLYSIRNIAQQHYAPKALSVHQISVAHRKLKDVLGRLNRILHHRQTAVCANFERIPTLKRCSQQILSSLLAAAKGSDHPPCNFSLPLSISPRISRLTACRSGML